MTAGFHLTEVRFRGGTGVEDAIVTFGPGLSVVAGPSNTGKSQLRSAINFVFGAGEMKNVEEAAPYRSIFVEIKTAAGSIFTFERAWNGGDIRQYTVAARDIRHNTPSTILAAKHFAENQRNISNVLLTHAGLAGTKILRYKSSGETRNLSFRDLVEYLLISEERIITELSPIHTDDVIAQTAESSVFRVLLSGKDDKDIPSTVLGCCSGQRVAASGRYLVKPAVLHRYSYYFPAHAYVRILNLVPKSGTPMKARKATAEASAPVDRINGDRRSDRRYDVALELRWTLHTGRKAVEVGTGTTVDLSSGGILMHADRSLPVGKKVELSISWPVHAPNIPSMRLVVSGVVVRAQGRWTAVRTTQREFQKVAAVRGNMVAASAAMVN